jgi:hypothetical protein
MKTFNFIFMMLTLSTMTWSSAQAADIHWGNKQCRWYDTGHEEHWGGHPTQAECNAKHHGSCYRRCTETIYICTARPFPDGYGSYTAEASSEWEAERRALRQCEVDHLQCRASCTKEEIESN